MYKVQELTHRGAPTFHQFLAVLYEVKNKNQCCGDHSEQSARLSV